MKRRFVLPVAIFACAALVFVLTGQMVAQEQKTAGQPIKYEGRINVLNKEGKTISIQAKSGVMQIKYTDKTQFTYRNKPGTIDDMKEGRRIIALVDPAQKKDVVALRIDIREGK
jgi:hypothetical protein